jgi:lipid II:glycine glycyltransferase (peptidoglycan interpeptide bridge formation enzyme)
MHFPKALFEALAALPSDEVNLWLADFEGKVIGGLLVISYAVGRSIYWGSAMHLDYTRLNPTKMLLREAIRAACERGDTILNMGPSAGFDSRPLDGVRQLKESFGGQPHDYAVGIYTNPWALRFRGLTDRAKSLLKRTH